MRADLPITAGYMRGSPQREFCFFTESFVDELARRAGMEPLAFRMSMLGGNGRLARCLQGAARLAQWDGGGAGSTMGIAGCSAFGSHIGLVAAASIGEDQRIKVHKLVAAVDCGRVVNSRAGRAADRRRVWSGRSHRRRSQRPNGWPECRAHGRSAGSVCRDCPMHSGDHCASHSEQRAAGRRQRARHDRARARRRQRDLRRIRQEAARAAIRPYIRGVSKPPDHPEVQPQRIGVLLINLGTPDAPEAAAVRRYLAEFLSDPRVVEIPAIAWKPILHGIILRTRPKKSAEAYNQIWTNEGSPLRVIAQRQAEALRARLAPSQRPLCHALRSPGHCGRTRAHGGRKAARGSSRRRSIRNIAQPRRQPRTTQFSPRSRACASSRRCGRLPPYYDDPLHIEALRANLARQMGGARLRAGAAAAELPRNAAADARPRRPLSLPLPEDRSAGRRGAWDARRCRVPVAVRESEVAGAGHGRGAGGLSGTRRQTHRDRRARLFRRLSGDARGARDPRPRNLPREAAARDFALLECLNDSDEGIAMLERLIERELAGWLPPT